MENMRRGNGCLWAAIGVLAIPSLLCVAVLIGVVMLAAGLGDFEKASRPVDEYPRLNSVWSYGAGTTVVVRIAISGVISRDGGDDLFLSRESVADRVLRQIRAATIDPEVRGIILEIDSPGGDVTACDEIHHALQEFKTADEGRVVVAILGDLAASGGYYVACMADYIMAQPTTVTGSIGVIISALNFTELGQKIGVKGVAIKSGPNKNLLDPLAEMTPEQRAMLQEVVDILHQRFVLLVAAGRKLTETKVRQFADGRIMTADRARDLQLVDGINYWPDIVVKIGELLGTDDVKVIRYEESFSFHSLFKVLQQRPQIAIPGLAPAARARIQYIWRMQ